MLLAEDHAETAERLRKLLRTDFDVIASVEDGDALVDAAERLSPDVIVTDIAMPGIDGIEATVADPPPRSERADRVRDGACRIDVRGGGTGGGALGYVLKDSAGDELIAASAPHSAVTSTSVVSSVGFERENGLD